jgi:RNA polymerase sigma-70 factor (ECF subfamily)
LLGAAEPAGDVVQETWTATLRGLARLDDPSRFPAWIYAIATRKCADAIRGAVRRRRISNAVTVAARLNGDAQDPGPGAESAIDIGVALKRLPADQRAVVSLYYGEDLTIEEIAAALNAPEGTIKSRLRLARQTLKRHLEGESHDQP